MVSHGVAPTYVGMTEVALRLGDPVIPLQTEGRPKGIHSTNIVISQVFAFNLMAVERCSGLI